MFRVFSSRSAVVGVGVNLLAGFYISPFYHLQLIPLAKQYSVRS